jgi:hypothetical protein
MKGAFVGKKGILTLSRYTVVCLFVFLALQPIVVVFSQSGSGL